MSLRDAPGEATVKDREDVSFAVKECLFYFVPGKRVMYAEGQGA